MPTETSEDQPISGIPDATSIVGARILGTDADGKTKNFKISDIKGDLKGTATAATDPGTPVLAQYWKAKPGVTYTNFLDANAAAITIPAKVGELFVLTAELVFDGTNWAAEYSEVSLSFTGYATTVDLNAYPRSNTILDGANTYNYLDDIDGFYINSTSGALSANGTSAVSKIYPITAGQIIYLFNRTGDSNFRFLDASNVALKPLKTDGTAYPAFSTTLNGGVKAPAGAVGYQFTTKFTGTTNRTNIIVSSSSTVLTTIKQALIPPLQQVTDLQASVAASQLVLQSGVDSNTTALNALNSDIPISRINKGESTATPEAFPPAVEGVGGFGVTNIADTTSPTKDIVGRKHIFSNTMTADGATCYRIFNILIGTNRPPIVSFAFWVKKTEFQAIFTTGINSYFGVKNFTVNPTLVLAGTPQTVSPAGAITEYTSATLTATKIAEVGAYIRLRLTFSAITWNSGFVGTSIPYYFLFNGAASNGKSMEFIDFTVLFNQEPQGTIIYPDPQNAFGSNVVSLKGIQADVTALKAGSGLGSVKVKKVGAFVYVSSPWSATLDLVKAFEIRQGSFLNNGNLNFLNDYTVTKGSDISVQGTLLKVSTDDITPVSVNGSYVGGNHSWNQVRNIVASSHGKTLADVGAIYKDSANNQFTILRILDANNIWAIGDDNLPEGQYGFNVPVIGNLTYVSNGVNNTTFSFSSSASAGNGYTTVTQTTPVMMLDGKTKITADGTYYCEFMDVLETYNILDLKTIRSGITSGRPTGGYLTQPLFNQFGDALVNISNTYRFTDNGNTVVFNNFRDYKAITLSYSGVIQCIKITDPNTLYIPKSLPISDGVKTFDFRNKESWTAVPAAIMNLTSAYWENPLSPPDRFLNTSANLNLMAGYITDRGSQTSRKDAVNNAIFLNTTGKIYPYAFDKPYVLSANSSFSTVAFRSYTNPANNPTGRTNFSYVDLGNTIFIFLDYHGAIDDNIAANTKWIGKKVEVYEKNAKCILFGNVVTASINILSTASATDYGFIVLKIS
ncbi:hypothetical protein ACVWYG_002594 [Pedobacter sp. UYEF25]